MKRSEKAEALKSMAPARDGYTTTEFASPRLRAQAKRERGHCRMTPSEVAEHLMGRGAMNAYQIESARRTKVEGKRTQRVLGGQRITGRIPGTKKPSSWRIDKVERATTKR